MRVSLTPVQKSVLMRKANGAASSEDDKFIITLIEFLAIQHAEHADEDGCIYIESGHYELTIDTKDLSYEIDKVN
jgi:hypothetical protein